MGWFRFDDKAIDNPKMLALSDGAFRLWIEAGAYCNKHLTDGVISRAALAGFRYATRKRIDELAVGLWDAHPTGFVMHDYLQWNDCKADVEAKKNDAKERMFRRRSSERTLFVLCGLVLSDLSDLEKEKVSRFVTFWSAYPRKVGKAAAAQAFERLAVDDALLGVMLAAVARQKQLPQWQADGGQFIPHAATWLNQRRWEDEIDAIPRPQKLEPAAYDAWKCPHTPVCHNRSWCFKRDEFDAMKAQEQSA